MRAWVLRSTDGPDGYRLEDVDEPEPGATEVRVRVRAAALNHLDLWVSRGQPKPPLPHVAGADGAGIVDAVGAEVRGVAVGDEVVINPTLTCGICPACTSGDAMLCSEVRIVGEHRWGTLAEALVVPGANVVKKPAALDWAHASAIGVATSTALRMLRRGRVVPGERVLVAGAGGGVGSAAVAVALALGAEVFVTSTNKQTLEHARALGAAEVFDAQQDGAARVREATGGVGVDCVIEHVGPATWDGSIGALARGGRLVTCGGTSGAMVKVSLPVVFWRQLEIIGSTMANPSEFAEAVRLVDEGLVPAIVDSVYSFEDLPEALAAMEQGGRFGKIVLA